MNPAKPRRPPSAFAADCRGVLSQPALRVLLLVDFLVLLAQVSAVVVLPWWVTSRGGVQAVALLSVTVAVATFIAVPALSPFGDRLCKSRQIRWGLGGEYRVAA